MSFKIIYSKQATKFLSKQPKNQAIRIIKAIERLPEGDVKMLKGQDAFRLRVGDYRIIFGKDYSIINIIKIDNRGSVYK